MAPPLHLQSAGRSVATGITQWHRRHSSKRARLVTVRRLNEWWTCVDTWEWWFGTDELRLVARSEIYAPAAKYNLAFDFSRMTEDMNGDDTPPYGQLVAPESPPST